MNKPNVPAWYDVHAGAYARNVGRLLAGQTLDIGNHGVRVTIDHVRSVVVGIDSNGLFVGITVLDTNDEEFTLYSDGTITNYDDREVGKHAFKTMPLAEKPAGVL